MRRIIVSYKVKSDRAEENAKLIEAVFAELNETQPVGLRYASFQAEDGLTFFHFASIETAGRGNPLDESPAFARFQEGIRERCEILPQAITLNGIGSYRLFED